MMFNAVFAGEKDGYQLKRVYNAKTREKLDSKLNFLDSIITYGNFKTHKKDLESVEYLFSTWGMPCFDEKEIKEYFPALRAVFYAAGSVQGFARPFFECGIRVFCAAAINAIPVAEFTSAQILLANKGYYQGIVKYKSKGWQAANEYCNSFPGNYGGKIGILGAGRIGKEVIKLIKPYHYQIYVFDPFLSKEEADILGVKLMDLTEIFKECPVITNHLANNSDTVGILDYKLFSMMKDNGTFINTGRGAQVVEAGLIQAMKEKPNRTALLDVTFPEPPIAFDELYSMDNVFLSPHIAGSSGDEVERMGNCMYEEFLAFSEARNLQYEVTVTMLETMA
ncbi:hydroxyacid dehydrogenase [Anaerocolumna sp. MB42-C2]|uniref:hydroxyacid dehydrogenase n=1 Tax=Anaerocolumna sp. MB42-C2 TaxID=3070997 RepID=UPI0027E076E7|nr:hydroxyacid dehydrogenase [Anaerocolumna sp. MB42-C2]WMJ86702.1 hydroxyacid dehydrogenase [Anaerocolumna sp. MB42-C2]